MIKPGTLCYICNDKNGNIYGFRLEFAWDLKQNIEENQLAVVIRKQVFTKFKVTNATYYECLINGIVFVVSEKNLKLAR